MESPTSSSPTTTTLDPMLSDQLEAWLSERVNTIVDAKLASLKRARRATDSSSSSSSDSPMDRRREKNRRNKQRQRTDEKLRRVHGTVAPESLKLYCVADETEVAELGENRPFVYIFGRDSDETTLERVRVQSFALNLDILAAAALANLPALQQALNAELSHEYKLTRTGRTPNIEFSCAKCGAPACRIMKCGKVLPPGDRKRKRALPLAPAYEHSCRREPLFADSDSESESDDSSSL